jgi:hypothetical protein
VPFRDLEDDSRFKKYQKVSVDVIRSNTDRRPETRVPQEGSIVVGEWISSDNGWAQRRPFVEALGEYEMCDLVARNKMGSGPEVPSLAVVRTKGRPRFVIQDLDSDKLERWKRRAEGARQRQSLFGSTTETKPPFEVVPFRFAYRYRCRNQRCGNDHDQTIIDQEVGSLWRHVRRRSNWRELMRQTYEDKLWAGKDATLFVGNAFKYPASFMVLGVFSPPMGEVQQSLRL